MALRDQLNGELRTKNEKAIRSSMAIEVVTPEWVKGLKTTKFQRPITENKTVLAVAEGIKTSEEIPGIIEIGVLDGKCYKLDGQHRLHAFTISGLKEALAKVVYKHFDDEAAMGEEFIRLNSAIARFRPDDILRAYENSSEPMQFIRKRCPFVGYDSVRRGSSTAPIVSMSVLLRSWGGSAHDVPRKATGSALSLAHALTMDSAKECASFLLIAEPAWGRDPEYARLWAALNTTLSMWLYRRTVIAQDTRSKITADEFRMGMSALSADSKYIDWLLGRHLTEGHRSPAYGRLKTIVGRRIATERGKRVQLPDPAWSAWTGYTGDGRYT